MLVIRLREGILPAVRLAAAVKLADVLIGQLSDRGLSLRKVYLWVGTPDHAAAHLSRFDTVEVATALAGGEYGGATATLVGTLGPAELSVDVDVYADSKVSVEMATTREVADVVVDVVGRAGRWFSISSFRHLLELTVHADDILNDLYREMQEIHIRYIDERDIKTYRLARLVDYVDIPK